MNIGVVKLDKFLEKAAAATYTGEGEREKNPERKGFVELVYEDGDWFYRDSYAGFTRSWGTELVRYKGEPVWNAVYGGGLVESDNELARNDFAFHKKALSIKSNNFRSFRGPSKFEDGDWTYTYKQEGDIESFNGYEEIKYKGKLIFWHRIIGGLIANE